MSSLSQRSKLEDIRSALSEGSQEAIQPASRRLLNVLGYRSERTLLGQSGHVSDLLSRSSAQARNTKSESYLSSQVRSFYLLFQVTDEEIKKGSQSSLLQPSDGSRFDWGSLRSYLFVGIELRQQTYTRSRYAELAREVNKHIAIPTFLIFRTSSGQMTLAFVHRREHKRDSSRQVLGRVQLIREIDPAAPNRAHLEALSELSLDMRLHWMRSHGKPRNFNGLLAAILDTLDTQELNKRFYKDLFAWFERAVEEAKFPDEQAKESAAEEHVIRLITRMLFVWFIKEKGLVADDLFVEAQARSLLKNYDPELGDSYYRAVLQNLFFATLNCEISKREWSSRVRNTHRVFSRWRFRNEVQEPERLVELFAQSPFINGGLFDCLDSVKSKSSGGYRIDCFSDNVNRPGTREYRMVSVPNRLFFDARGLFTIFNRYKFTVEENTPTEIEVALDPELLGRVFENLLAAYNPETRETVRKETGSFYTPRPVVDYMVGEALVEALAAKAKPSDDDDATWWRERLRYLVDYEYAFDDAVELFEEVEVERLIRDISNLKVLDPACGSGAFPMGVLHRLTLMLRRIDESNSRWEALQKKIASERATQAFDRIREGDSRAQELQEISNIFEQYKDSDYGRKLYLIQNSIYGSDIQAIACQIAKLRFFISLSIEQQSSPDAPNMGIRPLPNLETKFVAADSLLALRPAKTAKTTELLTSIEIDELRKRLQDNRERYFHANSRDDKLKCIEEDQKIREELCDTLSADGFGHQEAERIATWDPFDQNECADWFDANYMFGVATGFDIVIGNPPYLQLQKNSGKVGVKYKSSQFSTFVGTGDLYQLFFEKGCELLSSPGGVLAYITSNSWLKSQYGATTREHLRERHSPLRLIEMGKDVFESAIVDSSVLILREGRGEIDAVAVDMDQLPEGVFPPEQSAWSPFRPKFGKPWMAMSRIEQGIMDKMESIGTPLKEWDVSIYYGIKTGYNPAFIIDTATRDRLIATDPSSSEILKPILRGRDIARYRAKWAGLWLIDIHNGFDDVPPVNVDVPRRLNWNGPVPVGQVYCREYPCSMFGLLY